MEDNGRVSLGEAVAAELDVDLTPELMVAIDKILIRLYLSGFILTPLEYDE